MGARGCEGRETYAISWQPSSCESSNSAGYLARVGSGSVSSEIKSKQKGVLGTEGIKWNFTKFLVARDGTVLERYAPSTKPEELAGDIAKAIG